MEPALELPDIILSENINSAASIKSLRQNLIQSYPDYAANFDVAFKKRKENWLQEVNNRSSDYTSQRQSFAQGIEFEALVAMGPKIMQLILHELLDEENFVVAELYDVLEKNPTFKVDHMFITDNHSMQRQASLLIEINCHRNAAVKSLMAAWEIHQEENNLSSFSHSYTSGEAYDDLVEMGDDIIGHIMNDYAKELDGWHHELLHQIIHSHKERRGYFQRSTL